ncbi:hypothetical protein NQ315_015781 [Exocentrus adspersus]|uniref:Major facilitator superfamily (MFS) profile domain-containing protein n=1 Tax=Exocentrus adspersus TaxID=1586481 RepID=A0AAV8W2V9_9CUCU|nr:hypothetical protein NQ315_015781 [Exocentrus adspersus]
MECQLQTAIINEKDSSESDGNRKVEVPSLSASVKDPETVPGKINDFPPPNHKANSKPFTFKQKVALMMLGAADFMSFCSMSIMAPFYPQEAANKGMTESMAGYIFGFYALVVFVSSPVFGKVLPKLGVKFSFIVGLFISGICSVIFGMLHTIEDYTLFTVLSFTVRGFGALGAGIYSTAAYVIIINIFPDNAGAVRGLLETFVGLGMSAGPGIGGILFAIGGFGLPFYVVGLITILIAPLNIYLLPSTDKCEVGVKSGSLKNLLKLPPVIITCLIMMIVAMTWGFLDPTLEPHLRKFKLSPGNIGLIFLLLSAMYGLFCPAWGWLTDKMDNYCWLMTTGLFCNSIILLIMGPSPVLSFLQDSIWLNIVSLSALGIFVAMALMPTYQFILDTSLENGFVENLGTHSVIAGLWSSVYSLGEVLGPVLGGYLMEKYDFPVTTTTFSGLNLAMAVCGSIFFVQRRKTKLPSTPPSEQNDNIKYYNNDFVQISCRDLEKNIRNESVRTEYPTLDSK